MTFTQSIWRETEAVYQAILAHPFNEELVRGALDPERFRFYLVQDERYLVAFSQALFLAAARAERPADARLLADAARECLDAERALHATLFRQFGLDPAEAARAAPAPACFHYENFLLRLAYHEPVPVLMAGLLPCFWIYWEVGRELKRRSRADNPYQAWIDLYAGEEYAGTVRRLIELTDIHASESTADLRARMAAAFLAAARLEWLFWESAYRKEAWPVP